MTIDSPAVLLVQNDVEPAHLAGFDAWYLADHMPDRVATQGFRRARRWRAVTGGPRDLTLYEIDAPAVMSSAAYLARLAAPTDATSRYMRAFIGMRRSVCDVRGGEGFADGGCAGLLPIMSPAPPAALARLFAAAAWRADPETGIVARAVLCCDTDASRSDSVESRLRNGADQVIHAAAWIEAATQEQAGTAMIAAAGSAGAAGLTVGAAVLLRLVASMTKPPGSAPIARTDNPAA
jgi:hypothetical protein